MDRRRGRRVQGSCPVCDRLRVSAVQRALQQVAALVPSREDARL
jgi:hypothetical protein